MVMGQSWRPSLDGILLPDISAGLRLIDAASRSDETWLHGTPTRKGGSAASACEPAAWSLRGFSLHRRSDIITIHHAPGGDMDCMLVPRSGCSSGRVQLVAVTNRNPKAWPATLPPRPPRLADGSSTWHRACRVGVLTRGRPASRLRRAPNGIGPAVNAPVAVIKWPRDACNQAKQSKHGRHWHPRSSQRLGTGLTGIGGALNDGTFMTAVSPHPHSIPTRDRERWLWWCTEVKHPLGLIGNLGREQPPGVGPHHQEPAEL